MDVPGCLYEFINCLISQSTILHAFSGWEGGGNIRGQLDCSTIAGEEPPSLATHNSYTRLVERPDLCAVRSPLINHKTISFQTPAKMLLQSCYVQFMSHCFETTPVLSLSLSLSFETLGSIEHVFGLVRLFFLLSTTSAQPLPSFSRPTPRPARLSVKVSSVSLLFSSQEVGNIFSAPIACTIPFAMRLEGNSNSPQRSIVSNVENASSSPLLPEHNQLRTQTVVRFRKARFRSYTYLPSPLLLLPPTPGSGSSLVPLESA